MSHPLKSKVEAQVKDNPVVIYMKGSPDQPQCGFSARACQILKAAGVKNLAYVNVLADDSLWEALEEYSEWPTVPQIFIGGEFIGGSDIITEMFERGDLEEKLKPLPNAMEAKGSHPA